MIWKKSFNLASLNDQGRGCAVEHLGIVITAYDDHSMTATMPVDARTRQPIGLLHGGASVLLAETLGSMAGNLCVDEDHVCVGLDINANHLRATRSGIVTATARPVHLGRQTQVWQIDLVDEQNRPVCCSRLTLSVQPLQRMHRPQ